MIFAKAQQPALTRLLFFAGAAFLALVLTAEDADARRTKSSKPRVVQNALTLPNSEAEPLAWSDLTDWANDDHGAAFATFRNSCQPILKSTPKLRATRPPLYGALYEICREAAHAKADDKSARAFFETHFRAVRVSALGEGNGFLTGYYEPIVEGALYPSDTFTVPLYSAPSSLVGNTRVRAQAGAKPKIGRKIGRRKVVAFYDRTQIEDGVLAGRGLEICYLKDPVDAFFAQIQGSARVRLEDGRVMRINYQTQNGHPYTAVGKFLIERKAVAREDMSMDRIRQWMQENPEEAKALRRENKSYVFFRKTDLQDNEEAIGAQGIPLTAGRSLAVDRNLHVYGTPFFVEAQLPLDSEKGETPFRRLMVAQDTGGAITGIARGDIYFGAGEGIGSVAGRVKHAGRFAMLVPRELDPARNAASVELPKPRPSALIAREAAEKPAQTAQANTIPLPRPKPARM